MSSDDLYLPILNFYKKLGKVLKLVLCPILLVCFVLWFFGNFCHIKTLFMFAVGLIVSAILMYFYGDLIYGYIDKVIIAVQNICQEITSLF